MTTKQLIAGLMIASAPFLHSCKSDKTAENTTDTTKEEEATQTRQDEQNAKKLEQMNNEYSRVPDDKILENGDKTPLFAELKGRYKADAAKLKQMVEATGAKLVFICLTPEINGVTESAKYGAPFIAQTCKELGIEFMDFAPLIAKKSPQEITQVPRDGHWSIAGAKYIADNLAPIIKKYSNVTSTVTYKDSERPETFGDLPPGSDEIRDGGKDMPYHVVANSQGVRMDHDVKFPKGKKKHILFMGDSGIFCPFLNNEYTITAVLQAMFPDYEMMNTGTICWTLDDYVTLWNEKAKYSEPDIVFVQTNGGDIVDYYFSTRNHLSRTRKPYMPSALEEEFYKKNFPHN